MGDVARIQLRDLCGTRAGDKGDISNVALFAYSDDAYDAIVREVTAERVKAHFGSMVQGDVTRYEARNVLALNFVMRGALLRMEIDVPASVAASAPRRRPVVP